MPKPIHYLSFNFWAIHMLRRIAWSENENQAQFGPCCNPNGHGHNFVLTLGFFSRIDQEESHFANGYVEDYVNKYVTEMLHMKSLNDYLDNPEILPTCEHIVLKIHTDIKESFNKHDIVIHKIDLRETRNNEVTYKIVA